MKLLLPNVPPKLLLTIVTVSSLSIASVYLVANTLIHFHHQLGEIIRNFSFIFLYLLTLWSVNLLAYNALIGRVKDTYIPAILVLGIGSISFFCMIYFTKWFMILPSFPIDKPLGHGFRGFMANIFVNTFLYTTHLLGKYRVVEAENQALKNQQLEHQLSQLKAQLNPHFLFNSLNTLKSMVQEKDENSVAYLIKLAELYRYFLDNSEIHLVSLREEIKAANAYFFMLKSRFEENIHLDLQVEESAYEQKIPAITLQLLLENAVKHNVVSKSKPLHIRIEASRGTLSVSHPYQPKRTVENSTKIGLQNLNNRCKLLIHREIIIEQKPEYFSVSVPLL